MYRKKSKSKSKHIYTKISRLTLNCWKFFMSGRLEATCISEGKKRKTLRLVNEIQETVNPKNCLIGYKHLHV